MFTEHVPLPLADDEEDAPFHRGADEPLPHTEIPAGEPVPEEMTEPATKPQAPGRLEFIEVDTWEGTEVPPRVWLVRNRLPAGEVALLQGDGAAGKTTIATQLLAATVLGTDWLGAVIDRQGPAMFLSAEEDNDEIHRRFERVARHCNTTLADLKGLHVRGIPGQDALLGISGKDGVVQATPLFVELEAQAKAIQPVLIVIETAADVFGGNENSRPEVRQFIAKLRRLTHIESKPTVLLLGHPSLYGLSSGSGTSGSTGWHNSVRARLYFSAVKAGKGNSEEPESDLRQLEVKKSNYGPAGEVVKLRWQDGVFVPEGNAPSLERIAAERDVDEAFLRCLDAKTAMGVNVSPAQQANNYAPKMFEGMPQAGGVRKRAFVTAMARLEAGGRITREEVGSQSRRTTRLVRVEPGGAE
jgi:RecA-family ATPase